MMTKRSPLPAVLALVLLSLAAAALLTYVWQQTSATIALNQRNFQLQALNEIVPPARYDNKLFDDTIKVLDPDWFGTTEPVTVYRARKNNQPVAVILTVVAPKGYSGLIHLLVGINNDGTIAGVRAGQHHETTGLGDNIDTSNSDWILRFNGKSIGNPPGEYWTVSKDGGQFDQFTGATITPRAIVKAVRDALVYFNANRETLFAEPSGQ